MTAASAVRPIIAPVRTVTDQATLWPWVGDRALAGPAAARHFVGAFFEEATRVLTGARPHLTTPAADICPDLSHDDRHFLEVKALASGSAYAFAERFRKDRLLEAATGGSVLYVYWLHHAPTRQATSLHHLRRLLADHTTQVLAIPSRVMRAAAARMTPILLTYRAGRPPERGYRFSRAQLLALAAGPVIPWQPPTVHGLTLPRLWLQGRLGDLFGPLPASAQALAAELEAELAEQTLQVELAPAPRPAYPGHMVRCVVSVNPPWYRRLAATWGSKHRRTTRHARRNSADPDIRRPRVLAALARLSRGVCRTITDLRLLPLIRSRS